MGTRDIRGDAAADFHHATTGLASVQLRPEVRLTEVPAPGRIAPYSLALSADVIQADDPDEELATGRFVLLHDPECPEAWHGAWRVVTFARARLEPEVASDPLLGDVGWAWLTEALSSCEAPHTAAAGTVTRVVSDGYGGLADGDTTVEMEVRASWTPTDLELPAHLRAWGTLLCTIAGLPPLPEGVVALPGQRR